MVEHGRADQVVLVTRLHDLDDLVTNNDVAAMAGVVHSAPPNWRVRWDFPEPLLYLANGMVPVWSRVEVLKWLIENEKVVISSDGEVVPTPWGRGRRKKHA